MPPSNDDWANATDLGTTSTTASWDNTDATMETGEPNPNNVNNTVWFKCTGQDGYRIRFDAGGSTTTSTNPFDPNNIWTIGVYTGASVSSLTTEAFAVAQSSFPQPRTVNLRSGEEFYIQLGSWVYSTYFITNGVLNFVYEPVPPAPSNDDWANATLLTGSSGSISGTTDGSSIDSTDPDLTHWYGAAGSVWFKYVPDASGVLDIDTLGSSYDSVLAVVTGTPGNFRLLAGDDDSEDFASNEYVLQSRVRLQVQAGVTYYVFLDGYVVGAYILNWSLSSSLADGDDFRNPIALDGLSGTYSGNLRSFSVQDGESLALSDNSESIIASMWFSHTVGENGGGIQVTSAGSFEPDLESGIVLSVYEGDSPTGVIVFDDYTYTDGRALVADLDGNQTYLIRVAVPSYGIPDDFTLEWSEEAGIPAYFNQFLPYKTELIHRLSDMPVPRKYGTAVTIQDYVAFIGGENLSGELKHVDLWDIKAGEWIPSFIPDLPEPRSEPVVVSFYPFTGPSWAVQRVPVDNEPAIFVVGGRYGGRSHNQTWMWKWGATEWASLPPMPTARWGAAGTIALTSFTVPTGINTTAGLITQDFQDAEAYQEFVVPIGNSTIDVDLFAAMGGDTGGSTPGWGGRVQATIAVTPGETLRIYVGGRGLSPNTAGFNGGGRGGDTSGDGGGGGGATDIRRAPYTLADRLVVAGGGGGASGGTTHYSGGHGGQTGGDGTSQFAGFQGNGATSSAPGSGGTGTYGTARDGALGQGGQGYPNSGEAAAGGGGGGGGLYGGQGGGETGGGGGGSSGVPDPTASDITYTTGVRQTAGVAFITYYPAPITQVVEQFPVLSVVGGENENGVVAAHEVMAVAAFYPTEPVADQFVYTWQSRSPHPEPYAGWKYLQQGPLGGNLGDWVVVGGRGSIKSSVYDRFSDVWTEGPYYEDFLVRVGERGGTSWDSGVAMNHTNRQFINTNTFSVIFGGALEEIDYQNDSLAMGKEKLSVRTGAVGTAVDWGATTVPGTSSYVRTAANNPGFVVLGGGESASSEILSDFWFVFHDDQPGWLRVPEPCTIDISYMKTTPVDSTITVFSPICFRDVITTDVQTRRNIGPLFPGTSVVLIVNGMMNFSQYTRSNTAYKATPTGGSWFLYSTKDIIASPPVYDDIRVRVKWKRL